MTAFPFGVTSPLAAPAAIAQAEPTDHYRHHGELLLVGRSLSAFLRFLARLGQIHLTAIHEHGGILSEDFGVDAARAEVWASQLNEGNYNLYWAVNEVSVGLRKKRVQPRSSDHGQD